MRRMAATWGRAAAHFMLAVFVGSACSAGGEPETLAESERFAFVHASVIPMDRERVLPDQTVIVAENRIVGIGPTRSTEIPEGVTRIDATGRYLIPAFCDMHVHLLGDAWNIMLPPEARVPIDDRDRASFLFAHVANGVTTVQVLSATEDHIGLRERIGRGEILGPRLILARMIDGPDRAWPPPLSTWVASPAEAREAVLAAQQAGYDAMKVYSFLDPASYEAIISTANEVGLDVIGHIPMALSVEHVLGAGQRLIAHSEEVMKHVQGDFSRERIDRLAQTIAASDTWISPTLVTTRNILALFDDPDAELSRPEARYFRHPMQQGVWSFIIHNLYEPIPDAQRQAIRLGFEQFQRPFTRALHERGVKLLAGTDAPLPTLVPGFALHRELEELVAIGLSPYEALRSSTTHPYEYLGEIDQAGTVEVGKQANLVLLEENPLADITHTRGIAGVVVQGRWLPGDQIRERMSRLAEGSQGRPESGDR